jgi:Fe-S cluster biosynthesis and repair protein YggX
MTTKRKSMTKAQIEFFKDSANIRAGRAYQNIIKKFPQPKEMTLEEKVAAIVSGKAQFNADLFHENNCPGFYGDPPSRVLSRIYTIPGDIESSQKVTTYNEITREAWNCIVAKKDLLLEEIILNNLENPVEALEAFENMKIEDVLTKSQINSLKIICKSKNIETNSLPLAA